MKHIFFAAILTIGFNSHAADKTESPRRVKRPKSWNELVVYVLENGVDRSLKAPATRTLGYDQDTVPTKSLHYKRGSAPDDKEHVVHAIFRADKEKNVLTEVTITSTKVSRQDGSKHIDGLAFRLRPDGTPISAFRAVGAVGDVVQTPLDLKADAVKAALESEKGILTTVLSNTDFDD